jgi:hypothetical protein
MGCAGSALSVHLSIQEPAMCASAGHHRSEQIDVLREVGKLVGSELLTVVGLLVVVSWVSWLRPGEGGGLMSARLDQPWQCVLGFDWQMMWCCSPA